MRASVIVTTRDRAPLLEDCLRSILADRSRAIRELVVVDNASSDATAEVVRDAAAGAAVPVRYVREERLGQSHARNAGAKAARGEILVFTDDDVVVREGWVDALVRGFDDPAVGAVGGRILPDWEEPPPAWLDGPHAQLLTLIDHGAEARDFAEGELPLGANMAVRADVARAFDPLFDPRLGHRGRRRLAHEEYHLMSRIRLEHRLAYRPDAVVLHRIPRDRVDLSRMRRAFVELGLGLGRKERIESGPGASLARRAVRAGRTVRGARRLARRNEAGPRSGPETWDELYGFMWAGRHVELLLGRFPRLSEWTGGHLA